VSAAELSSHLFPIRAPKRSGPPEEPDRPSSAAVSEGLSVRSNFAWVLTGNVIFAMCQWGMIVALAKTGSTTMVGQFSLGLAIATPILMFSNFDLRAVQATDASREYRFVEYLHLRIVMTLTALLLVGAIAWMGGYERRTAMIISAVAIAKGIETLSDIHYGLFQLNGRLDQMGRSMMLRGVLSVTAMSAGLFLSRDVLWGCISVGLAWLAVLWLFDVRRARQFTPSTDQRWPRGARPQWKLARIALPMGIVTTVASLNLQMPRYFIHARMGDHALGVFSALAYTTVAMTLVGDSLGHCVVPRLSRLYAGRRFVAFRALLMKLLAGGCAVGIIGLALAQGFGARLLRIFYSSEYATHAHVFVLLTTAAAIHFAASMLTSGITSARYFRIQVPLYLLVTASTAIGCAWLIPTLGLTGGALAVIAGAVVRLVLAAVVVRYLLLPHTGPAWGQA
jgi:O-antigen/teichoic acid export membrane protein